MYLWLRFDTNELPFSVWNEAGNISTGVLQLKVDSSAVVGPRAELHLAHLIVEGKPRDVDLTGAEEETRRNPETVSVR